MISRLLRLLLGLATVIPVLWVAFAFWAVFVTVPGHSPALDFAFGWLTRVGLPLLVLLTLAIIGLFIDHELKTDVPHSEKMLWVILLLLCFPFTGPVYWYLRFWRQSAS